MAEGWTEERVEELRRLAAERFSAQQISEALGEVSRSAVLGKAHRLGIELQGGTAMVEKAARPKPAPATPAPIAKTATPKAAPVPKPIPLEPEPEPSEPPPADAVTLLNLRAFMCRWPLGDPRSESFRYCGARTSDVSPYCPYHRRIAYEPARGSRRDDNLGKQSSRSGAFA